MSFPRSIHLGGGSFATAFEIGVLRAMEERWEEETGGKRGPLCDNVVLSGDSAGAAIAAGWCLGMSWVQLRDLFARLAYLARTNGVWGGKMTEYHEEMLDVILGSVPDPVKTLERRKFGMGVTRFFATYETYTAWRDLQHLRHCFHCSFHVPIYCAYQPPLDGRQALDGGFARDGPIASNYDLTVGRGECAHISMLASLSEVVYPPSDDEIDKKILEGYRKGMSYRFGTPLKASRTPTYVHVAYTAFPVLFRAVHYVYHLTRQAITNAIALFRVVCEIFHKTTVRGF